MKYIKECDITCSTGDTYTQAPLPEATLTDIVRDNTVSIHNIMHVVDAMYQHLYGNPEEKMGSNIEDSKCFRDEILAQSQNLLVINEKLARICSKLGM